MKVYKSILIPERIDQKLEAVFCDLCKEKITCGTYQVADVVVSYTGGYSYSDNGSTREWSFDICPQCFREKLMVWLKEQGAEPSIEDSDW